MQFAHATPSPSSKDTHTLSLLPTAPPLPELSLGTTSVIPPTPDSLTENPHFLDIAQSVLAKHATQDPEVQTQAKAFASQGGSGLGSGGSFFPEPHSKREKRRGGRAYGGGGGAGGSGAGGASAQGGMGGGGVGGWVHVSDQRNPPDWGRVAWPEDILGSLEVDGRGRFVSDEGGGGRLGEGVDGGEGTGAGRYQRSGTYRICTREGM